MSYNQSGNILLNNPLHNARINDASIRLSDKFASSLQLAQAIFVERHA